MKNHSSVEYRYAYFKTDFCKLIIISDLNAIKEIHFVPPYPNPLPEGEGKVPSALAQCLEELQGYLYGNLKKFTCPLDPEGTPFQNKVWGQLMNIPYGETVSYEAIAGMIQKPRACRAVGMANNRNPIPIIIPCHRVIGKNGAMTGYKPGIDIKRRLLEHERRVSLLY